MKGRDSCFAIRDAWREGKGGSPAAKRFFFRRRQATSDGLSRDSSHQTGILRIAQMRRSLKPYSRARHTTDRPAS